MVSAFKLMCSSPHGSTDIADRPKSTESNQGRLSMAYFAGHRATHFLMFPCCICVTESAVYIAGTGLYRGFWVASCAQDLCGYIGDHSDVIHITNNSLSMMTVPLDYYFTKANILEKRYPNRSKLRL